MSRRSGDHVPWRLLSRRRRAAVVLLLSLPVLAMLAVPLYSRATPEVGGVPFFYAYQFAWVPLSILAMWGALRLMGAPARRP